MSVVVISAHAAERYCERIDPSLTPVEAIAVIRQSERAILAAAAFGSRTVRRGDGVRFVLDGAHVITVLDRFQARCGVFPRREAQS